MNIIVCIKQVVDPEAPPSTFRIDAETNRALPPPGIEPVISTFDEYAVEAALRLKESQGGKITVIGMGVNLQREVMKKPLAMGADELILMEDSAFADGDGWTNAYALSMAIKKAGSYDVILCGRQSSDWDSGQVGSGIAQLLDLPSVTLARKITAENGKLIVERVIIDGIEIVEVSLPALVTLSNEHAAPRYPSVKGIMAAKKKEPIVWKPADIGVKTEEIGEKGRRMKLLRLFQPSREDKCEVVTADNAEEAAGKLAQKLREAKVI